MVQIDETKNVPTPPIELPGWRELAPHVARRMRSGITQGALAGVMGTSPGLLSLTERGQRRVTAAFHNRYIEALDRLIAAMAERDEVANLSAQEGNGPL